MEDLFLGQTVIIRPSGEKAFNRDIAAVILQPCSTNLAVCLVRGGYAWPERKYSKSPETDEAARLAAEEGQGLWQDSKLYAALALALAKTHKNTGK